ncbi:MAG: Uma2 family endonuclease [Gemmatimonadota bacterium]
MSERATAPDVLTLEEFERLPDEDPYKLELTRGRVVREPPPGAPHGWLVRKLFTALHSHIEEHSYGIVINETGFLLSVDPPTVRQPDLAVIRAENLPREGIPKGYWTRAPDLAIEVLSPSNTAVEIQEKVLDYLTAGTRLVWVVDPHSRSVIVYGSHHEGGLLTLGDDLDGGEILPHFRLPLAELFEPYLRPDV